MSRAAFGRLFCSPPVLARRIRLGFSDRDGTVTSLGQN